MDKSTIKSKRSSYETLIRKTYIYKERENVGIDHKVLMSFTVNLSVTRLCPVVAFHDLGTCAQVKDVKDSGSIPTRLVIKL